MPEPTETAKLFSRQQVVEACFEVISEISADLRLEHGLVLDETQCRIASHDIARVLFQDFGLHSF